jgi:RNA polymerase sigma-70 factor (ECF subfamily)
MLWLSILPFKTDASPPMGTDVQRHISELQAGIDAEENFRWIFSRYYRPVFRFFSRRGIPADRCDDLTQEVFLRVYIGIARFRGESSFTTWLFRITWNLCYKQQRSAATGAALAREVVLDETVEADGTLALDPAAASRLEQDDPLRSALARERSAVLQQELRHLPPQMRRCVVLRIDRGLKYREIAALMQISIDTVKSQLNQAKTRLKARLGEPAGERLL